MPASVTLADMMTEVRRRSNQEITVGLGSNQFVADAEIRALLNTYLAELYDLLVENRGQDYYRAAYNFSTVANTIAYALPAALYKLISVDLNWATNIVLPVRPYMEAERNKFKTFPLWAYSSPIYYQLQAGNIAFIPTPASAIPVVLNYIPAFVPFLTDGTQDGNSFDGINGWQDFAVWGAVGAIGNKEGRPTQAAYALGQQEVWRSRVIGLAASRDLSEPPRVQQVRRRDILP